MSSSDSMNYNRSPTSQEMPAFSEHSSSTAAGSSSDSGNTEKISSPPSTKQQTKTSPKKNRNNIPIPSKPSSSVKRPRDPQEKGASKRSSKKSKKPAQEDIKGKAAEVPEAEKSAKRGGPIWNPKDEAAFLRRLLACCEKGKGLPKNMGVFYEAVNNDLDGDYSNHQLHTKYRGLKTKFNVSRGKVMDKGFAGFKNAHEDNLYRLSSQIWGNKEEEEEVGTEKAGKGGNARLGEKKKNLVADPRREREGVNMNKNGDVDTTLKEQEGEEEDEEDESDSEEGEEHDEGDQNVNVNLSQHDTMKATKTKKKKEEGISHISEGVLNRVADTGTQRSKVKVGEEEGSSEDNEGEEKDSSEESDESESESTDDEDSALRHSNAALILSRSNAGGSSTPRDANIALKQSSVRENSTPHVSNGGSKGSRGVGTAAAGSHDARENLNRPFQNGTSEGRRRTATTNLPNNEENLVHNVPSGITNGSPCVVKTEQYQMFDRQCKENIRMVKSQLQDMLDGFKNDIVNLVNTTKREFQRPSNTARTSGFDFSMISGIPSGRELPSLSKTEAEMLDQKWQKQQLLEMEAASKHLALLQEEYQLCMAKFRHQ